MQEIQRVIVVGGAESLVKGNFGRKLQEHGISVDWHIPMGQPKVSHELPKGAQGMVIMQDMVGHRQSGVSQDLARRKNLPVVIVPRRWCHAEPLLRLHGFLPVDKKDVAIEYQVEALDYTCLERRKGRTPSYDEVNNFLHQKFTSKIQLTTGEYHACLSKASAEVPIVKEVTAPPAKKAKAPVGPVMPAPPPPDPAVAADRQAVTDIAIEMAIMFKDTLAALVLPLEMRLANLEDQNAQLLAEIKSLRAEKRS